MEGTNRGSKAFESVKMFRIGATDAMKFGARSVVLAKLSCEVARVYARHQPSALDDAVPLTSWDIAELEGLECATVTDDNNPCRDPSCSRRR